MSITPRNILAFFFALWLIFSGKVRKARQRAMDGEFILSIYFHNPSKKEFESIVKWFIKRKFRFLSLQELRGIMTDEITFPKGAVVITVDDGWGTNEINIVEIADRYRIPVTIFVSTEPVEQGVYWWSYAKEAIKKGHPIPSINELKKMPNRSRLDIVNKTMQEISLDREAMTVEQVQRISKSDYITIGGHTHTHPVLINCSDEDVRNEMSLCNDKLTSWTRKRVEFFAYPNGDFSYREIEVLKELGYEMGFANNPEYLTRDALRNNYSIPRLGFLEGASFAENICRMMGVWKKAGK